MPEFKLCTEIGQPLGRAAPFSPESPVLDVARSLRGRRVQVFTDFDGTLVDIGPDPLHAELAPAMRAAVEAVAACHRLAVVSGRDLANLRGRVRLPAIAYAGNHGLEISGPGYDFTEPTADADAAAMADVVAELRAALPGVEVQDKRLTATVHVPGANAAVRETV